MKEALTKNSRNWALAAHLGGSFAGYVLPLGGVLVPLVIWLVQKDEDEFVAGHALEALNFQITVALAALVGVALCLTVLLAIVGFPLLMIVGLASLVYGVLGAIAASNGRQFEYPRWVFRWVKPS